MNKQQEKDARVELLRLLTKFAPSFKVSRIRGLTNYSVTLEGGKLPAIYIDNTKSLSVWNRSTRNSGDFVSIDELKNVESICEQFFLDYMGRKEFSK